MGKVAKLFRDGWPMTADGLKNLVSGLGTSTDKSVSTQYYFCPLSDQQLLAAYRSDWIARKAVDIPAQDAVREWRSWQAKDKQIEAIVKEERRLGLRQKVQAALIRARLFGGGVIIIGADGGNPKSELKPDSIKKDGLKFLHVLARNEITAKDIETDPLSEYYGEPKMYELKTANGQAEIHPSRVVRMIGNPMPNLDIAPERVWGDSILQAIDDAVKQAGTASQALVALIQEAKTDIVKIPGLMDNVSTAEYENKLLERFTLASKTRSIINTYILDSEEEWQRQQTNFSSLPDAVRLYLQIVSGAADIPATRMIGVSPQGMNATGDSDTRNYYDKVSVEQENVLRPALMRLDECLIRSALGSRPEEVYYDWVPLWQLDEKDRAEVSLKKAQALKIHQDSGLLDPHALSEGLINQIIADGVYPGLSITIEDNKGAPALNEDPATLAAMHSMKQGLSLGNPGAAANLQNPKMKANQMAAQGKGAAQPAASKAPRARTDAGDEEPEDEPAPLPPINVIVNVDAKQGAKRGKLKRNPDGSVTFEACGANCECEECKKYRKDYNECHEPEGSPKGGQFCSEPGAGGGDLSKRLKQEEAELFRKKKNQWAEINNKLLAYVDNPNAPEAQRLMDELRGIVKDMYGMNADQGGIVGLGLPGGPRDVVIIGGGPGGLAAGIMGGTEGLDTLLIEASDELGGQARMSSRIENYPGFPIGVTGQQLTENMIDQAERVGTEMQPGVAVTGLSYDSATGLKTLTLSNGETIQARSVVIAGGVQFRKLDFEGSDSNAVIYGDGKALTEMAAGSDAVVIGGSNGAAQAALGAATKANHVTLLARSSISKDMSDYQVSALRNNPKITVLEGDQIASFKNGTVTTAGGQTIQAKAIGVFVGSAPKTDYVPASIKSTSGKIVVNGDLQTSIPGVFAVGDVREGGIGRIGGAVGDGQMAIKNVFGYFEQAQAAGSLMLTPPVQEGSPTL